MSIQQNIKNILQSIPNTVSLVAVSKTKPIASIEDAYACGQRIFGENKVQEMVDKHQQLPKDISWHMIGHVQRNKIKYMASFVDLIHGVDSIKTLLEIEKQAKRHERVISCLLQIKIAEEDSKFGLSEEEATKILTDTCPTLEHVSVVGFMGMATFTKNIAQIQGEFSKLNTYFNHSKATFPQLQELSMGMSGDYAVAIDQGSTMIRVGSSIFGHRNYT